MLRVIPFILVAFVFVACSSSEKQAQTAEALYKRAQEYENDDRFEEAIRRYQEVRSKYPYSPQAVDAEMAVADVYYKQESFAEAQTAYQSFRDLHPKHVKMPYVLYRYAMSLYMQLPETIDRDLSLAPETILAFNDVLKKFPQSEYAKESGEKRSELIKKMAEKEIYIADFYYKKSKYLASLGRYEYVLKQYAGIGFDEKATARAAYCAHKVGDPQKTRQYSEKLQSMQSLSSESRQILKEIR